VACVLCRQVDTASRSMLHDATRCQLCILAMLVLLLRGVNVVKLPRTAKWAVSLGRASKQEAQHLVLDATHTCQCWCAVL
jgi:hypothetical protein